MPAIIPAIAKELANGVSDALKQASAVVTGTQGNWIANGEPESIYGITQQAAARQACRRYADNPNQFQDGAKVLVENACRPYLSDIGYGTAPTIKLPFRGGQCSFDYSIFYFSRRPADGARLPATGFDNTGSGRVPGPIRGTYNDFRNPGGSSGFLVNPEYEPGFGVAKGRYPVWFLGTDNLIVNISTVQPWDGVSADNCGSVPPDIVGPVPPPNPGPVREPFNPSPGINVDIGVRLNPDGTIDIDFGTGDITIDPFGDGAPSGGDGPAPGDVGSPGASSEAEDGQAAEGEAPPGSVLTGLKVDILDGDEKLSRYTADVRRAVGYFYMGVPGLLDQDFGGSMLRSGQFLLAEKDNLTAWRAVANVGIKLRITPYYRETE